MTIHRLMYWLFLAVGMILFATVGFLLADPFLKAVDGWFEGPAPISPLWTRVGLTTAGLLVGILVANHGFQILSRVARHLEEAEPDEKLAIGLGLVSAAVITFALYPLLFAIGGARLGWALTLLAFVILVYLSVVSFLSMKEYLPLTAQMARRSRGIKVLDSSVIIDGRIRDIIRTGFSGGQDLCAWLCVGRGAAYRRFGRPAAPCARQARTRCAETVAGGLGREHGGAHP
jgi:uncharacterized protein YacL